MSLGQYYKKRNFSKTPEPKGKVSKEHSRMFVIQKHAASHLHYDFRIELHGVLKSWAIPKGPSLDPEVKRLAMQVEDHPIQYGSFEGIIPKGQYGGGTVMLWDKGSWEPLDENPYAAYEKGHLRFLLHAEKLQGRWDLIRFKDEKHWFLIKHNDEFAKIQDEYDITEALDRSVLSNYNIDEIATHYDRIWNSSGAQKVKSKRKTRTKKIPKTILTLPEGLIKSEYPDFIPPQLATLVDKPPVGGQWLHEIKFDGYRILAYKNDSEVLLKSRNNLPWTSEFPSIVEAIGQLPFKQLILDGEIVILDAKGRSDFQLLQNSLKSKKNASFDYFLFDLVYFEGYDLRKLSLLERKAILKNILEINIPLLHYSEHIIKEGKELYQYSCQHSLEGIISKKASATYISKRNKDWLKIKCIKRQEFIIGGYSSPKGGRSHFGSLFLGVYNKEGTIDFIGNVGTGFTEKSLGEINKLLQENKCSKNPFNTNPPGYTKAHWLKPTLVCEVEFTEWTKDDHIRHPSFKGLRLDKKATEVLREVEIPLEEVKKKESTPQKTRSPFVITNPDKVLYPEDHITKKDLLAYYEAISDYILPYISLRPLTLVRCPSHYNQCFYQRHFNSSTPDTLHPIEDPSDTEHERYIYLNNKEGLLSLIQMGVLEIHPWGSRIDHLDKPDILVIDLDPAPDVPWKKIVSAAKEIREHLTQYQLKSFVKSTGGKGLHVVIPILPEYDWETIKEFTHVFVQFMEKLKPNDYISNMAKAKRTGKIFVDYLRNQRTATAIGAYSTRARHHAPVSAPLAWDELSDKMEDNSYTIKTLPNRLKQLKEDPWKDFWHIKQSLRLDQLE
ncbi:DNA ligase D [Legionella sainthelensi]|uniref:DNA ligase D n=1 Tax=Legionella sainthelensi TaxID=28087 RepID=UPI000EF3481A|nr:DNA ligase D [Legionella sainthelensi]AYK03136.1 DNA ligase D [Legionella sainthelensi]